MQETIEDEDYEDAYQLKQEFSNLASSKREQIENKKNSSSNDDTTSDSAINGWVEGLERKYDGRSKVEVKVQYVVDGDERTESFTLDRPTTEEEFSVNNRFVRLVNYFGERRNDPSSLMHRKVWLKYYSDGSVQLDIPDSLSTTEALSHRIKRTRVNHSSEGWDDGVTDSISVQTSASIAGLFAGLSAYSEFMSQTSLEFATMNVLASPTVLFFGLILFVAILFLLRTYNQERVFTGTSIVALFVILSYVSIGGIEFTVPSQSDGFQTTVLNLIISGMIVVVSGVSAYLGINSVKSLYSTVDEKKSRVKRWYKEKKGVEFVEET